MLLLPGYLRRMVRRGHYRENFGQRFGLYSTEVLRRLRGAVAPIWLQAVSVGEMLVALKLIAALRERDPDVPLVLSTTTTTGFQLARERVTRDIEVIYTPVDFRGTVRRSFGSIRPRMIVIVDGGLWPNMLSEARRRRVPTVLVNARLSPRSERRFRRLRFLTREMFRALDLVCVPEGGDVARWETLGVPAGRLRHTGSVKFDDAATPARATKPREALLESVGLEADGPVLLAGSTHPGEERAIAEIFLQLKGEFPLLRLIVAPRHAERSPEIRLVLERMNLRVISRAESLAMPPRHPVNPASDNVLLLDTTGELNLWYSTATVVFIGKSLTAIGGQNPAEAILAGGAVVFGPHMENFRDLATQLLECDGAVQVRNPPELKAACRRLLADPTARAELVANARQRLAEHRGAAGRTADLLLAAAKISACQAG